MQKNEIFYEEEILKSINKIEKYIGTMTFWEFSDDEKTFDAVCMQLQHIWECGVKLLKIAGEGYKNIPFSDMQAFRNRISHDYIWLDDEIIWKTIKISLVELKNLLQ